MILQRTWLLFSTRPSTFPAHPVIENSCKLVCKLCVNFQLVPRHFPGREILSSKYKVIPGAVTGTATITEQFMLYFDNVKNYVQGFLFLRLGRDFLYYESHQSEFIHDATNFRYIYNKLFILLKQVDLK